MWAIFASFSVFLSYAGSPFFCYPWYTSFYYCDSQILDSKCPFTRCLRVYAPLKFAHLPDQHNRKPLLNFFVGVDYPTSYRHFRNSHQKNGNLCIHALGLSHMVTEPHTDTHLIEHVFSSSACSTRIHLTIKTLFTLKVIANFAMLHEIDKGLAISTQPHLQSFGT